MGFLKALFSSKKAGAALIGILAKVLTTLGLDPQVADAIVQILEVYILAQAGVDVAAVIKGTKLG